MYAEAGLLYPYFQSFSQEVQPHLEDFCVSQKTHASMINLAQMSTILEYDLGAEGDLFKAPEPIIGEPAMGLDLMTASMSMIPCGEDVISPGLKVSDIESIHSEQLLSEVFYECKKDLLAKTVIESPLSEVLDIKISVERIGEAQTAEEKAVYEGSFQKSVSSGSLSSMDWLNGAAMRPNFLDFPGMDFGAAYGMRRAFSEGDIKTLGNGHMNLIRAPLEPPAVVSNYTPTEDRQKKLSRYRNKRTKRNFGRKIKYACRKALADSQPRIRGRFAKTEELDMTKKQ